MELTDSEYWKQRYNNMKKLAYATAVFGTLSGMVYMHFLDNERSLVQKQPVKKDVRQDTTLTFEQYLHEKFKF